MNSHEDQRFSHGVIPESLQISLTTHSIVQPVESIHLAYEHKHRKAKALFGAIRGKKISRARPKQDIEFSPHSAKKFINKYANYY